MIPAAVSFFDAEEATFRVPAPVAASVEEPSVTVFFLYVAVIEHFAPGMETTRKALDRPKVTFPLTAGLKIRTVGAPLERDSLSSSAFAPSAAARTEALLTEAEETPTFERLSSIAESLMKSLNAYVPVPAASANAPVPLATVTVDVATPIGMHVGPEKPVHDGFTAGSPTASCPATVPDRVAPPPNVSAMVQSNLMSDGPDFPVMRAFPATAPPKPADTVTVNGLVGDFAVHESEIEPVDPTPSTEARPGALNVPLTSIGPDGRETEEVQSAPTFAVGVLMSLRSVRPSVIWFVSGANFWPTVTASVPLTDVNVQSIPDADTMGERIFSQSIDGVMFPASGGRTGRAPARGTASAEPRTTERTTGTNLFMTAPWTRS